MLSPRAAAADDAAADLAGMADGRTSRPSWRSTFAHGEDGSATRREAVPPRPSTLNEVARRLDSPTTGEAGGATSLAGAEPVGGPDL